MRILLLVLFTMLFTCRSYADSSRSQFLLDVLKSPQFTIQYSTDGSRRMTASVTVLSTNKNLGNRKVTLIKNGDKRFVGVEMEEDGKHWTTCYLEDKDWRYYYHIFNGQYYDNWVENSRQVGQVYTVPRPNMIRRSDLLIGNDIFSWYWDDFMQFIGVTADHGDFTKPAVPLNLSGSYYESGQESINDTTYEYDEYRDETIPGLTAKNRYYYKDGDFVHFVSLGKCIVIEPEVYRDLFFRSGFLVPVRFEASDQTKSVRIHFFSNSSDLASFEFPKQVMFKDVIAGQGLMMKKETAEFAYKNRIEGERKLETRRNKLFNSIKYAYDERPWTIFKVMEILHPAK